MTSEEIKDEIKQEDPYETADLDQPAFKFIPTGRHSYRQEGYYLVCRSCELHHAVFIGPEKVMVGEDEKGTPILKSRLEFTVASKREGGNSKL